MLKLYTYSGCSTCRGAVKWLRERGIAFEEIPIRECPPSRREILAMAAARDGGMRRLFNTSGRDYRDLGIKDRLAELGDDEAANLLAGNGNLIRRPFAIDTAAGIHLSGFKEAEWAAAFGK